MENSNFELMENAPVKRAILKLAVPTVLSTIIQLVYNLTDTYFIGLLDDPLQLAAINLAFPVFMLIQALGNIFGSGAPSYVSRCLGAKHYDEAKRTSSVSFYASIICSLLMTGLAFLFMDPILHLVGTSQATFGLTKQYMAIICGCSVVLMIQIILPSLIRAEGKVKEAVIGMVIGTVINIILDPVFILGFHQGVAGAAWATVIGNAVADIYYIIIFLRGKTTLSIAPRDCRPSKRILCEVFKIGLPSSVAQIIMSVANILTNNLAVAYGDAVISAFGVAGKLVVMIVMIVIGFVTGYAPFAGYSYGARNTHRLIEGLKFTMACGTVGCVAFLFVLLFGGGGFMRAFSSDSTIIDIGIQVIHAQAWAVPFMAIQMTMMATFQATGQAIKATVVNLGRQCLFYLPLMYLFNSIWHLPGLMYAQCVADILTTLVAVLLGIPFLRKIHKMDKSLDAAQAEMEAK